MQSSANRYILRFCQKYVYVCNLSFLTACLSWHLSRQPPSLPASQFKVCTSRFTRLREKSRQIPAKIGKMSPIGFRTLERQACLETWGNIGPNIATACHEGFCHRDTYNLLEFYRICMLQISQSIAHTPLVIVAYSGTHRGTSQVNDRSLSEYLKKKKVFY